MPELRKATVYRQVDRLLRGAMFMVEEERRMRGAPDANKTRHRRTWGWNAVAGNR